MLRTSLSSAAAPAWVLLYKPQQQDRMDEVQQRVGRKEGSGGETLIFSVRRREDLSEGRQASFLPPPPSSFVGIVRAWGRAGWMDGRGLPPVVVTFVTRGSAEKASWLLLRQEGQWTSGWNSVTSFPMKMTATASLLGLCARSFSANNSRWRILLSARNMRDLQKCHYSLNELLISLLYFWNKGANGDNELFFCIHANMQHMYTYTKTGAWSPTYVNPEFVQMKKIASESAWMEWSRIVCVQCTLGNIASKILCESVSVIRTLQCTLYNCIRSVRHEWEREQRTFSRGSRLSVLSWSASDPRTRIRGWRASSPRPPPPLMRPRLLVKAEEMAG